MTVNTLAMRHMMQPFRPGDRLEDHAVPIGEVMQQLQTQLAEYRALKEQLAIGAAGVPGGLPAQYDSVPMQASESLESNNTSASSSFLHIPAPIDTSRLSVDLARKNS